MEVKSYSLAILGDSGVGKTALAYRIVKNEFMTKETKGGEYFQKISYFQGQTIKIDIYGTSGKEKYQKISKYLYKDAKSIIIMYKVGDENSFNNIYNYLDNIECNSVENPIIYIVGNYFYDKNKSLIKNVEKTKIFNDKEFKHFVISCKNEKNIDKIMNELTNEILNNEKWYPSKMEKSYKDSSNQSTIKINKKTTSLKNILRCLVCHKPFVVKFKAMFSEVSLNCVFCKTTKNIKIKDINEYKKKGINCSCKKKSSKDLQYCKNCKNFFCNNCNKTHNCKCKLLYPYNLMDNCCCYEDEEYININIGFCKKCNESFCKVCDKSHRNHEQLFYEDILTDLIKEKEENIEKEKNLIKEFKKYYDDCLETLKRHFESFIKLKEEELKLKEELLSNLKNIQNNYQLYETVKNLRFMKKIKYDSNSSWDQKLTDIFEVIGMPIQIKNINISRNIDYEVNPTLINLGSFDNPLQSEYKDITDICSLDNDKLTGISFNNGTFEIYENLKIKKSTFTLLENNQSINSIYKSKRNINNFFICCPGQIKKIEFYDDFKSYKTISELTVENKNFILCLEQDDYIITSDINNKIEIFSKNNKKINEITEYIDPSGKKTILSLNEISNNLIYITYNKIETKTMKVMGRCSMNIDNIADMTLEEEDLESTFNSTADQIEWIDTKIIDYNNYRVNKEFLLPDNQEILGVISDKKILIKNELQLILFDTSGFKINQRYNLDIIEKPIFLGILNNRGNAVDFILVDENHNIFQNIFNKKEKSIIQISGLNNKRNNFKNIITRRKKTIHNPFKSIITYLGGNDFIVNNYYK